MNYISPGRAISFFILLKKAPLISWGEKRREKKGHFWSRRRNNFCGTVGAFCTHSFLYEFTAFPRVSLLHFVQLDHPFESPELFFRPLPSQKPRLFLLRVHKKMKNDRSLCWERKKGRKWKILYSFLSFPPLFYSIFRRMSYTTPLLHSILPFRSTLLALDTNFYPAAEKERKEREK